VAGTRAQARGDRVSEDAQIVTLAVLLTIANLVIALRALHVVARSRTSIEPHQPDNDLPSLSIVVPARNEERNIERCVRSLLATSHPDFEVILVDDQSTDATREIAAAMAATQPRLHVLAGTPLPPGWVGKPWALWQGANAARGAWLLFTDADTRHEPLAACSAQRFALDRSVEALSLLTDQETVGAAERLFLPTILFVIMLGVGAVDDVNDRKQRGVAIFNGQYVLCSRKAYFGIGGHKAVRGEIAEDLELARLFKRDGRYRIMLAGASGLVSTRMYASFSELWQGFVKNFASGARGHPFDAAMGSALLACVSPLTPLAVVALALRNQWLPAALLALGAAAIAAIAEIGMRRSRFRPGSGLAIHLGLVLVLAIFATSLYRSYAGDGVEWRGRRYGGGLRRRV
jgi:chlorobactene glucosyltransferase